MNVFVILSKGGSENLDKYSHTVPNSTVPDAVFHKHHVGEQPSPDVFLSISTKNSLLIRRIFSDYCTTGENILKFVDFSHYA